jgi:hypothetical protein
MTSRKRSALFQMIDTRIGAQHPELLIQTTSGPALFMPADAIEAVTSGTFREVVWRAAIVAARQDEPDGERSRLFALWLAEPWLKRVLSMISERFQEPQEELEAEFVAAFLENLPTVDVSCFDPGERLLMAASRSVWALARAAARERPVGDPSEHMACDDLDLYSESGWELEFVPPPRPDRLSAPLRFLSESARLEGARLGMLAYRMGLADVVLRARRPSDDTPAGRLMLRKAGAPR